jgi:hypothetical protein
MGTKGLVGTSEGREMDPGRAANPSTCRDGAAGIYPSTGCHKSSPSVLEVDSIWNG